MFRALFLRIRDGRIGESDGLEMAAGSVYAELAAALKSGDEGRIAEAFTP